MLQKEQIIYQESELELFLQLVEKAIANEVLKNKGPVSVCIGGPSAAGKSTISDTLSKRIHRSSILHMDSYLIGSEESSTLNHDAPDSRRPFLAAVNPLVFDIGNLTSQYLQLLSGITIEKPVFDKQKNQRKNYENFGIDQTIIIEGLYALNTEFASHANFAIYVDAYLHDRLIRKIIRNTLEYKRNDINWIIQEYLIRNEPAFQVYSQTLKQNARYYFRNKGRAAVTPNKERNMALIPSGKILSLEPKYGFGQLYPGEKVMINLLGDDIFYMYSQDGTILINKPIAIETVVALENYYTLSSGYIT